MGQELSSVVTLRLKVVPGASSSELVGWLGELLKIRIAAAPEKGKANKAVESFFAKTLELPLGAVNIVNGNKSPLKTIEFTGLTKDQLLLKLNSLC